MQVRGRLSHWEGRAKAALPVHTTAVTLHHKKELNS